ncbi:fatty acid desaturase family protein [Variovorax sp. GT1P44]|uniref:fatty acid desaturase family protein n=1 Tax=Variovorax sp. GT1P44 TaxID=3443742 RepID=UPI003F44C440
MNDVRKLLDREELLLLQRKSSWKAAWMLAVNWSLIVASFGLVIVWPGVATVALAMLVLAGRQLGLGILMHECAHRSFTPSRPLNDWIGQWLCAAPVFADLTIYRSYHMTHHVKTGTADDPDLPNYRGYPVSAASLGRKVLRDLLGLTGLKAAATLAVLYAHAEPEKLRFGYAYKKLGAESATTGGGAPGQRGLRHLLRNARRILLVHALALALLWACGHPMAYLLWPATWLTTYMLISRIRNAAEHGALPGTMSQDIWSNTRTVRAAWWERLLFAPNFVNYHVEHHLAPTVPSYNLRRMHRLLRDKGALQSAHIASGYVQVVRSLVGKRRTDFVTRS